MAREPAADRIMKERLSITTPKKTNTADDLRLRNPIYQETKGEEYRAMHARNFTRDPGQMETGSLRKKSTVLYHACRILAGQ